MGIALKSCRLLFGGVGISFKWGKVAGMGTKKDWLVLLGVMSICVVISGDVLYMASKNHIRKQALTGLSLAWG